MTRETWPPVCQLCGKFMSYTEMKVAISWTPYGGYDDMEPPPEEWAHKRCWNHAGNDRIGLIERTAWRPPQWPDNRPRSFIRTVRHGRVIINGKTFVLRSDVPPTGLECKRFAFNIYYAGDKIESFISLWGSEENFRALGRSEEEFDATYNDDGKILAPDGVLHWTWWHEAVL